MLLLYLLAAFLLPGLPPTIHGVKVVHVDITTLITITSQQSMVKDYPRYDTSPNLLATRSETSSSRSFYKSSKCHVDSCLQALRRYNAQEFCSTFTNSVHHDTSALPSFANQCTGSVIARLSSACTCMNGAFGLTSTKSSTSGSWSQTPDRSLSLTISTLPGSTFNTLTPVSEVQSSSSQLLSTATQGGVFTTAKVHENDHASTSAISWDLIDWSRVFSSTTASTSSRPPTSVSGSIPQPPISSSLLATELTSLSQSPTTAVSSGELPNTTSPTSTWDTAWSLLFPSTTALTQPIETAPSSSSLGIPWSSGVIPSDTKTSPVGFSLSVESTFLEGQSGPMPTNIQTTFSQALSAVQPSSVTQPAQVTKSTSGLSPTTHASVNSFASTLSSTDDQGKPETSVSQVSQTSQVFQTSSGPSPPFTKLQTVTIILTDPQGNPTSTVTQLSQASQPPPNTQPASEYFQTVTLVLTDTNGNPTTTVIQLSHVSQALQSPHSTQTELPQSPTSALTDTQASQKTTDTKLSPPGESQATQTVNPSPPLQTVTLVLTDPRGNPTTTITQLSRPSSSIQNSQTKASPSPTFPAIFPSTTPPPTTTGVSPSCQPYPECLLSVTTNTNGGPVCSPLPAYLFPIVNGKPTSCSPFPSCLSTVIPPAVQNELSSYCDGTALVDCIFTDPNAVCTAFPDCLSNGVDPDICPGYPFPDCLFTVYEPKVTSVMTTTGPGVTIRTSSNDDYTKNTWSSSIDSEGHIIFFPIIVGCRNCVSLLTIINGIDGFFNTIFKFPPIPFPHFPKIPKLHFPCIFFCHKGHKHHKPKPPVYNEPDKENEENEEKSSTTTSESTTSKSSSSCEAATASACTVYSTVSIDGTKTTTMTSTSCSAETKCSATGHSTTTATTSSATPTATRYYITANREAGMALINAFTEKLKIETDPETLFVIGTELSTGGWTQALSQNQTETYLKEPAVASIHLTSEMAKIEVIAYRAPSIQDQSQNDVRADLKFPTTNRHAFHSLIRRDGVPIQQATDDEPLKILCQPNGIALDLIHSYAHQTEGPGARVYMVDSGFDATHHPLYAALVQDSGTPDWLWPGSAVDGSDYDQPYRYEGPGAYTDADEWANHGTAMTSRMVGPNLGVSKRTAVTIVRLPHAIPNAWESSQLSPPGGSSFESWRIRVIVMEHGLNLVMDDVIKRGTPHMSVVNLSLSIEFGLTTLPSLGSPLRGAFETLQALAKLGVTIVVAAGNGADPPDAQGSFDNSHNIVSEYAKWATAYPMIVVGGASKDGYFDRDTRYRPATGFPTSGLDIAGPSFRIKLAIQVSKGTYAWSTGGTSIAAAMTSGLIAYFLSIKSHHDNIKAVFDGMVPANGQDPWPMAVKVPLQNPAGVLKRQSGNTCSRPDPEPSSSIASLSSASMASASSASLASVSSASLAAASSASRASISSASLASAHSASLASASSASLASKSSANFVATATKTAESSAPAQTGEVSGYIESNCSSGKVALMTAAEIAKVVTQLCSRSYIWDHKHKPPRDSKKVSGAIVEASLMVNGIKTLGQIFPSEGGGSACASGTYPRILATDECQNAYTRLIGQCSMGGQLTWATKGHGCMDFLMLRIPSKPPPKTTSRPPPQTSKAPPPKPSSTKASNTQPPKSSTPSKPPATFGEQECFKSNEFKDQLPILPSLAQEVIEDFCKDMHTWSSSSHDSFIGKGRYGGLAKIMVTAQPVHGSALDGACKVNKFPRTLYKDVCSYALVKLKNSDCVFGGKNVASGVDGCFAFTMHQEHHEF
ncbi:hypothetical protein VTL71DRAFT_3415 [Oculimacula yallundae]|uniref:Subtilisin n=1 Tax=Oculimacula yallundae TaxID=86028 RepID=A0ABR4C726_9HELO